MRIAVIVPVLDEASSIGAALDALQPVRAAGHPVIIVDGGSLDRTVAVATPLADRVVRAARGRARQMNAGAATAACDPSIAAYLFLHADTRLPDGALDQIVRVLGAGCRWGRFDVQIDGRSRWLPVVAASMNLRSRWSGIATGDQAMFVARDAFAAAGGFPDWPLMEDIGLSRRLKRGSAPAALRQRVITSGRRWDSNGALSTIALMWWLRLRFALGTRPETLARRYASIR